jgi:transcriptional regulator with GAF, ATPase, and Fis domain
MSADLELSVRLAREFARETDFVALLERVVNTSLAEIKGAEHAGVTVLAKNHFATRAASDALVIELDRQQFSLNEGPSLSVVSGEVVIRIDDLRAESRWPKFRQTVMPLGIFSVLSFRLGTEPDAIGALSIYASQPYAFSEESLRTGMLLAGHAAIVARAALENANLRAALETRDLIGQAKGVLMERFKVTADQAFDLLVSASQRKNRKLRDVAYDVATTGEISNS